MEEVMNREMRIAKFVADEVEKFEKRLDDIHNRVMELTPLIHQNLAIIHRYSLHEDSFLDKPSGSEGHNRRMSWSGMVVSVSSVESDDPVVEIKKQIIKDNIGKTVLFNPESAYSLNVKDYPEIWVMHIDGFLAFDQAYDIKESNKKRLLSLAEITVR